MRIKTLVRTPIRRALDLCGYELHPKQKVSEGYLDATTTLAAAKTKGQTLSEYLTDMWGDTGVIDQATALLFERVKLPDGSVILEIGAGTGGFLAPILKHYSPARYEVYETDAGWASYLKSTYRVDVKYANGSDLDQTPSGSCDLVHAHAVFICLPTITAFDYFCEICRVLRPGGFAFFDLILADECTVDRVATWQTNNINYARILPRETVIAFFAARKCRLLPWEITGNPTSGERYLIFQKD